MIIVFENHPNLQQQPILSVILISFDKVENLWLHLYQWLYLGKILVSWFQFLVFIDQHTFHKIINNLYITMHIILYIFIQIDMIIIENIKAHLPQKQCQLRFLLKPKSQTANEQNIKSVVELTDDFIDIQLNHQIDISSLNPIQKKKRKSKKLKKKQTTVDKIYQLCAICVTKKDKIYIGHIQVTLTERLQHHFQQLRGIKDQDGYIVYSIIPVGDNVELYRSDQQTSSPQKSDRKYADSIQQQFNKINLSPNNIKSSEDVNSVDTYNQITPNSKCQSQEQKIQKNRQFTLGKIEDSQENHNNLSQQKKQEQSISKQIGKQSLQMRENQRQQIQTFKRSSNSWKKEQNQVRKESDEDKQESNEDKQESNKDKEDLNDKKQINRKQQKINQMSNQKIQDEELDETKQILYNLQMKIVHEQLLNQKYWNRIQQNQIFQLRIKQRLEALLSSQ